MTIAELLQLGFRVQGTKTRLISDNAGTYKVIARKYDRGGCFQYSTLLYSGKDENAACEAFFKHEAEE